MTPTSGIVIYTIGHSTRPREELIELLTHYDVDVLLDIRKIPYSRYNPQFNKETMEAVMRDGPIRYEHNDDLGGIRPAPEVLQRAKSCSERSRGFAAYMRTPEFARGLARVLALAQTNTVALMCAESDPAHCHRSWVADALAERGIDVRHIISPDRLQHHPSNLFSLH